MIALGTTAVRRSAELSGIEAQIGLFINTLPVIVAPQSQQSVAEYLQRMQALNLALHEHEHVPLYGIQRWAGYGGEALLDSILVFENFPVVEVLHQVPADLEFSTPSNCEQTNHPLTLGVILDEHLSLQYVHAWRDFNAANIAELDRHPLHLLQWMAETPQATLGELILFDTEERQEALRDWQALLEALPWGGVMTASAHRAASAPEVITLVYNDEYPSYAELDIHAECLVCGLQMCGVAAEVLAMTVAECPFDLVVDLLGILKAGADYLPLGPSHPAGCLACTLRDNGACWLIRQETLAEQLPCPAEVERLPLEAVAWPASADTRSLPEVAGETLVYVIYTSDSIGQLKGVAVSQAAFVVRYRAATRTYGVGPGDRQLQFALISLGAAAEQPFVPLLAGAWILLSDVRQWNAQHLADEMERHAVTTLDLSSAYLRRQAEELRHAGHRIAVHACTLGGEAWDTSLLTQQAVQAEVRFGAYGPTEAVITPLAWHCRT